MSSSRSMISWRNLLVLAALLLLGILLLFIVKSRSPKMHPDSVLKSEASLSRRVGPDSVYPPIDTAGARSDEVTQENIDETICVAGYTRRVRPPVGYTSRVKHMRFGAQGLPGDERDYELDHVIPLALGGCAKCEANLWMEPWPEAREKDVVEEYLHRKVCHRQLTLAEAQREIVQDWYAVYLSIQQAK